MRSNVRGGLTEIVAVSFGILGLVTGAMSNSGDPCTPIPPAPTTSASASPPGSASVPADPGTGEDGAQAAVAHDWGESVGGDEFDGDAVDSQKWQVYDSPGHAGNGLRKPEQVTVTDGHLRITGEPNGDSGGMAWQQGQQYGRWEVRMRVNQEDQGGNPYHPVLILWPDSNKWPEGGELDYAEANAGETKMQAFLHYGDGTEDGGQQEFSTEVDMTQWHNYAFEWTPDHMVGYIDGKEWFRTTDDVVQPPGPMHQTIQLDNFFPENGLNPATMDVDWVRMYDV